MDLVSATNCSFCIAPTAASLEDLGVNGPKACYLLRCPRCGQYWAGYAYQPHLLWALTLDEVARDFPEAILFNEM